MAAAGGHALGPASVDEVDHLDLYSCFASSLGVRPRRPRHRAADRGLTVTGGLPYHGGPGSNYITHALAAMAEALRADPGSLGLVTGVGHAHDQPRRPPLWSTQPGPSCSPRRNRSARRAARP